MTKFNYDPEQELGDIARTGGIPGPMVDPARLVKPLESFVQWWPRNANRMTVGEAIMLAHNCHLIAAQMIVDGFEPEDRDDVLGTMKLTFDSGIDDLIRRPNQ